MPSVDGESYLGNTRRRRKRKKGDASTPCTVLLSALWAFPCIVKITEMEGICLHVSGRPHNWHAACGMRHASVRLLNGALEISGCNSPQAKRDRLVADASGECLYAVATAATVACGDVDGATVVQPSRGCLCPAVHQDLSHPTYLASASVGSVRTRPALADYNMWPGCLLHLGADVVRNQRGRRIVGPVWRATKRASSNTAQVTNSGRSLTHTGGGGGGGESNLALLHEKEIRHCSTEHVVSVNLPQLMPLWVRELLFVALLGFWVCIWGGRRTDS